MSNGNEHDKHVSYMSCFELLGFDDWACEDLKQLVREAVAVAPAILLLIHRIPREES